MESREERREREGFKGTEVEREVRSKKKEVWANHGG